jgi:Protein of unknown function (DUF4058)
MPSPFPGMDPWVESAENFRDLHNSLVTYIREALNAALPKGYIARGTQLVWVDDELHREPDVGVFGRPDPPDGGTALATLAGAVAVAEQPVPEPWEQPYLEILTTEGKRLVTMVEVLSLSNKRGGDNGRVSYRQKQQECALGGVNLVEIDLLRWGAHTTAAPEAELRRTAGPFDYHACVMIAGETVRYFAVPIRLTEPLPAVPVPLDPGVPAVSVDLQPLFDRAYDTGRYADWIDYRQLPEPPLTAEQQAWASGILKEKGLIP